jgi:hypothetical protein
MKWKQVSLQEACEFMQNKTVDQTANRLFQDGYPRDLKLNHPGSEDQLIFTDSSAVVCESNWSGPYSKLTPDIDANPPVFWVGS